MLTYLRYILAAICLAASVGCLALWWRSDTHVESVFGSVSRATLLQVYAYCGRCNVRLGEFGPTKWKHKSEEFGDEYRALNSSQPYFSASVHHHPRTQYQIFFPLWFPALVFALAAVAAIRIGRQFTLRSALVGMSVVAALLGMVVAL